MLSMEDKKAILALEAAAKLADDGELDQRLANAFLNVGQYADCVSSANQATLPI